MSIALRNKHPNLVGKVLNDQDKLKVRQFCSVKCTAAEGRTRQEFAKELDINRIVDKYTKTGVLPFAGREKLGIYADVSELPDYRSQLDFVIHAKESFQKLDVNVRKRFQNNPGELLEFLKNPDNKEEAIKLGLVNPPQPEPEPEPPPAPPATEE